MRNPYPILATLLLMVACNKQQPGPVPEPPPTPPVQEKIPINISFAPFTKATDSAYESGDIVGLYVVNSGSALATTGNHADDVAVTFDGSKWKCATDLYWRDSETSASFYCYYPHSSSVADVKNLPFTVKTDQSTLSGYKTSELLWGSKTNVSPTSNVVEISSTHRMSNLLIYIIPGNGYTEETLAQEEISLTINNLKVNATLNLENGQVTAVGNAADIAPYKESNHYRALVPPQSIQDQTLVSLQVGDYSFSLKETLTLLSNTKHTVNLTVNKVSEGVNIGIGNWEIDENDHGGTVN